MCVWVVNDSSCFLVANGDMKRYSETWREWALFGVQNMLYIPVQQISQVQSSIFSCRALFRLTHTHTHTHTHTKFYTKILTQLTHKRSEFSSERDISALIALPDVCTNSATPSALSLSLSLHTSHVLPALACFSAELGVAGLVEGEEKLSWQEEDAQAEKQLLSSTSHHTSHLTPPHPHSHTLHTLPYALPAPPLPAPPPPEINHECSHRR